MRWVLRHCFPELNGYFRDGAFVPGPGIHLGVAISLREGGLVEPALRDADKLSLVDLMAKLKDLLKRGDISANVQVRPGDIIIVPQSWF